MKIVLITPDNIDDHGLFCIKDIKSEGYKHKKNWFVKNYQLGLKIILSFDEEGKQSGYMEYMPGEIAWRPVHAPNYYFIQCMFVYPNKNRQKGLGSDLIKFCIEDAVRNKKDGVCSMTSNGTWIKSKKLFLKNKFFEVEKLERFELMAHRISEEHLFPHFIDWTKNRDQYIGWHLIYADQCPWHYKAVEMMEETADKHGVKLIVHRLTESEQIRSAPSGFGSFSLMKDGKLLEDHYLSKRRFETILESNLK